MKINYAIMGSNNDPTYLDFWPLVSKVWKKRFNITPVLGLISDKTKTYEDEYGIIFEFPKIEGYSDVFLSQLSRLFLPKFLNGISIISDIDIFPISKKYFIYDLYEYHDDEFIILSSHHPSTSGTNQYPMCYVVGSDKNFKTIFNLEDNWETFIQKIPNQGWFTDQIHLFEKVNSNSSVKVLYPERIGGFFSNRIDRASWGYNNDQLNRDFYIDCHSLRPYLNHKYEIDKFIENLLF